MDCAAGTVPRGLHVLAVRLFTTCSRFISFAYLTCGRLIKLGLAYIFCFIIRNRRYVYYVFSGFTRGEYHIALVDFIFSSRGRLERDRGFANPLSLSNTSPDPFGDPLRRGILAAAVDRDIGFRYPVQTVCPHFDVSFGCLVFGLRSLAFQKISLGFGHSFFIGGGMDCSCLRLRGVMLWIFVGITADRAISSNFVGCKPISPNMPGAKVS